jgi:hypothetical protein
MSYAISAGSTAALPLSKYDPYKVTHNAQPTCLLSCSGAAST